MACSLLPLDAPAAGAHPLNIGRGTQLNRNDLAAVQHRKRAEKPATAYAASGASSIGSTIEGSSFSGLLTRVEIGHIRIRPARNCRIRSCGSGSSLSQRAQSLGANDDRHAVMDLGNQLIGISGDDYESP